MSETKARLARLCAALQVAETASEVRYDHGGDVFVCIVGATKKFTGTGNDMASAITACEMLVMAWLQQGVDALNKPLPHA